MFNPGLSPFQGDFNCADMWQVLNHVGDSTYAFHIFHADDFDDYCVHEWLESGSTTGAGDIFSQFFQSDFCVVTSFRKLSVLPI